MFFEIQEESRKRKYIELLQVLGSLSNLFSDSTIPYLDYRISENIFCRAFDAYNLGRADVSVDALKDSIGIGLKTYLHKNGKTFQKVAEFNKGMYNYQNQDPATIVRIISSQRNKRIEFTKRAYDLDTVIYHLVTRDEGQFKIYEENMDLIDLDSINNVRKKGNIIYFSDRRNDYKFNLSKSTLFKRFINKYPIVEFEVPILDDPFTFLSKKIESEFSKMVLPKRSLEYIYLPLYSPRDGEVHQKSGLNQWNAAGRNRHPDEVYIPIPKWIHEQFEGFFPFNLKESQNENKNYSAPPFTLELPNGKKLSAKVCQQNGKALMSNPNKELGKWLLRHVLKVPQNTLVTYSMLENVGIDSVIVTKISDNHFRIDFASLGSYEQFEEDYKNWFGGTEYENFD